MKKIICFVLLLSLVLPIALSSCHGSVVTNEFTLPESFDESRTYEITFWAKNDSNVTQKKIYEKAINDFQTIYPNIKVTMKSYTDYSRIYNDVITNIPTKTTPNVCIAYPDNVATYLTGENIVIPFDGFIKDEKYGLGGTGVKFDAPSYSEMISKFLNEGKINGLQYTIPFMRSSEALYINKDLVNKLGYEIPEKITWDFVWEVSAKAMEKDENGYFKVNNQKVMIPFIYKSTDNMMIQMLKQKGFAYSSALGDIQIFNENTESLLFDLAEECKKGSFSTFKISSYPGNFLNAGQCIFAIDSTAGATWMGTKAPNSDIHENDIVDFELVVTEIPQFDVNNPYMISQGPSLCIFNKDDPQEVLASWLFVQYLLTDEVQIAYSQTEGYVPVTQKAQNSEEYKNYLSRAGEDNDKYYKSKIEAAQVVLRNIDNTFVTPVFNGSASLRDAAGQLIENVVKSIRRKETVNETYMKNMFSNVESLYRLDQIASSTDSKTAILALKNNMTPLPTESIILISSIGIIWVCIGTYFIISKVKAKKQKS